MSVDVERATITYINQDRITVHAPGCGKARQVRRESSYREHRTSRDALAHVRLVGLSALPCGHCFAAEGGAWIAAFYSQETPPEADVPELLRSVLGELQDIRDRLGRLEARVGRPGGE